MFNQWVDGQPWWMTLLLLPAVVLGAMAVKIARYAIIAAAILTVLAIALAFAWLGRRR